MNAYQRGFFYTFATFAVIVFSGWVIKNLWDWYVVPLGMTSITVPHAIGLLIIVQLAIDKDIDQDETYAYYLAKASVLSLAGLIVGYLLSDFI